MGEKGGAGLLNEDIPGEYLMLLILGCSTDCSVAKLFRSNHFDVLSLQLDALKRSTSQRTMWREIPSSEALTMRRHD